MEEGTSSEDVEVGRKRPREQVSVGAGEPGTKRPRHEDGHAPAPPKWVSWKELGYNNGAAHMPTECLNCSALTEDTSVLCVGCGAVEKKRLAVIESNKKQSLRSRILSDQDNKDFNKLIRTKADAVSWVGNYTKGWDTGIEIGFLKKEAMALTVLLSSYYDGTGATAPVAMISGPGSLGRKLAIFYEEHKQMGSETRSRSKVSLGIALNMEKQSLRTLAKLGRADFYIGTLQEYLEKGQKKTRVVVMDGSLSLSTSQCEKLCGKRVTEQMEDFLQEISQSGQIDVADRLTRHLQFDDRVLRKLRDLATKNGHLSLTKLFSDRTRFANE